MTIEFKKHIVKIFLTAIIAGVLPYFSHAEENELIENMMNSEVDEQSLATPEETIKSQDPLHGTESVDLSQQSNAQTALPETEATVDLVEERSLSENANNETVEVSYLKNQNIIYREGRSNWSTFISMNSEMIMFDQYRSQFDRTSYDSVYGARTLNTAQGEVGIKYNFSLGSIGLSVLYGKGFLRDTTKAGDSRELSVEKMAGGLTYFMDTFFSEPYFAPYVGSEIYKFNWRERSVSKGEKTGDTDFAVMWTLGGLIQLNWIDPETSRKTRNEWGLTNMFLDVYVSQYLSEDEPDFTSSINYGSGLRFEF